MPGSIAYLDESTAADWSRSLYAFLAEKERRSGSLRTVQSYSRTLNYFFGRVGKTPDHISVQDVFAWAYARGLSGKTPSACRSLSRIPATLSSDHARPRADLVGSTVMA